MMVLRLNALLKGLSGIRLEVLERLVFMINEDSSSDDSAARFTWSIR